MKKNTYVSLFSSAGVGCYGFKSEGFECIATNEIIQRRLNIQKINKKCKYNSGYILGDIREENIKEKLKVEVDFWKKEEGIDSVDVIIATPPCQGMSVANHKKGVDEIRRNSLVVESLLITRELEPKVFIFENVAAFLNTVCTDIDGQEKRIEDAINNNLSCKYNIYSKVINFKEYGANSSRTRTIVIGVNKKYETQITPIELFPNTEKPKSLFEVIGNLPRLKKMGEIDPNDIYHAFRKYDERMRCWISDLKEGESAFDNSDPLKIPHTIKNGEIVYNKRKNGDKYTRQIWNKVAPCIHTRNDILASQNTIHPEDDRVFSIRELMLMMNIPKDFKWIEQENINNLSVSEKQKILKDNEINIRQSIGEAVPTIIFKKIAFNIKNLFLDIKRYTDSEVKKLIEKNNLNDVEAIVEFIENASMKEFNLSVLSKIAEIANTNRLENAAFYTDKENIFEVIKNIPDFSKKDEIRILEPSVGVGNFIFPLIKKYGNKERVLIDVVDVDKNSLRIFISLIKKLKDLGQDVIVDNDKVFISHNIVINIICSDFLMLNVTEKYDLIIGNPPYGNVKDKKKLVLYKKGSENISTNNIFAFFVKKSLQIANNVALIIPKAFLNAPEYNYLREIIAKYHIEYIIDFGEKGFKGVKIETITIGINSNKLYNNRKYLDKKYTRMISKIRNEELIQLQNNITDEKFPTWLLYRNSWFDKVADKMQLGIFNVFRDREITNSMLDTSGETRVLKSRNIGNNEILDIVNYDSYIDINRYNKISVIQYLNKDNVVMIPNLTYYPRAAFLPKNCIVNGSVALLTLKDSKINITEEMLAYFSTAEFSDYYKIARNYGTRSLNIDSSSVYYFGVLKEKIKEFDEYEQISLEVALNA